LYAKKPFLSLEKLARDKHSSLLRKFVYYSCKKFNSIGPWTQGEGLPLGLEIVCKVPCQQILDEGGYKVRNTFAYYNNTQLIMTEKKLRCGDLPESELVSGLLYDNHFRYGFGLNMGVHSGVHLDGHLVAPLGALPGLQHYW
jgi:hypothetical protein